MDEGLGISNTLLVWLLPQSSHCLTPFSELPAAHSAGFVTPLQAKASSWPRGIPHPSFWHSGPSTKWTPPPASAVSPITPLCPLAPYALRALYVHALFIDVVPLALEVLLPHLHLENAHLSSNGTFFRRHVLLHSNLL